MREKDEVYFLTVKQAEIIERNHEKEDWQIWEDKEAKEKGAKNRKEKREK